MGMDMDIRNQVAQVYGPSVIAAEKTAQQHKSGEGQHQDSCKRARRPSKHCPQCRWNAFAAPAFTQELRPTLPNLFAA